MASLHPQLIWQRVSPTAQAPDGPVLYQIQIAGGKPDTLSKWDSSGRHLTGSQITDDATTVTIGGSNGLVINASGNVLTFHGAALSGGLASVSHDTTLAGTGTSGTPLGVSNLGIGNAQLAADAVTGSKIAAGQVVKSLNNLFDGVTLAAGPNISIVPSGQILTISATGSGGGTVTSVATGLGLTGGPIMTSGTVAINPAVVPQLAVADTFTKLLTLGGGTLYSPMGTATNTAGFNSQAQDFTASSFNSLAGAPVNQRFRWQAEPVGNDTGTASGSMNLLFAAGGNPMTETGLSIASNGVITFAAAQSFPNAVNISAIQGLTATPNPILGVGTIGIAPGGVGTTQLAAGAVTTAKMSSGTATSGQVLTADGAGNAAWQTAVAPPNGIAEFTANGTFQVPAGITRLRVDVYGAGGGGGGGAYYSGGNGGGGAYAAGVIAVVPGTTLSVVIGADGTGGAVGTSGMGQDGGTGGVTEILDAGNSILISAQGGAGGGGGGTSAGSFGASGAGGAAGTTGSINHAGTTGGGGYLPVGWNAPNYFGSGGGGGIGSFGTTTSSAGSPGAGGYALINW